MAQIKGDEIHEPADPLYCYAIQKWDTDANDWLDEDMKLPCINPAHGIQIMKSLMGLTYSEMGCGRYRIAIFQMLPRDDELWDYELEESKEVRITKRLEWDI